MKDTDEMSDVVPIAAQDFAELRAEIELMVATNRKIVGLTQKAVREIEERDAALTTLRARLAEVEDILRAVKAETMGEPVGGGDGGTYVVRPISGATYNRIVAALAGSSGAELKPIPCVGCGAMRDAERCMGCLHDFGTPESAWVRQCDTRAKETPDD